MGIMRKRATFVGDTPWWVGNANMGDIGANRLGDELVTFEAMKEAGALDWHFEKRQLWLTDQGTRIQVPSRFGIVRQDTQEVLGLVSGRYGAPQPKENLDFLNRVFRGEPVGDVVGELDGGRIIWALAQLGEDMLIAGTDRVRNRVLLTTSYDGSFTWRVKRVRTRVVCENTHSVAMREHGEEYKLRNTVGIHAAMSVEDCQRAIGVVAGETGGYEEFANKLAQTPISGEEFEGLMQRLFPIPAAKLLSAPSEAPALLLPEPKRETLMPEFTFSVFEKRDVTEQLFRHGKGNSGQTRWDAFNGVSEFTDYVMGTDKKRAENLLFGLGSQLKQKTWDFLTAEKLFGVD